MDESLNSEPEKGGHLSVMLSEVVSLLEARQGSRRFLDGTFGWGGHSRALLEAGPGNSVLALDCDPAAVERAVQMEGEFAGAFSFKNINFEQLDTLGSAQWDGMLFDFGLASSHYDDADRGFSFRLDGPVDMRLDPRVGISAADFLERASEQDLVVAVRNYGEEQRWRAVVSAILAARGTGQLQRTVPLAELVSNAVTGGRWYPGKIHPATRTFQGIRILLNRELEVIANVLPKAFAALKPGGIMAVISFHSLEDRLVKRFFRQMAGQPEHARDNRAQQDRIVQGTLLTRHPLTPSEVELQNNPRSRSARLRAIKKGNQL